WRVRCQYIYRVRTGAERDVGEAKAADEPGTAAETADHRNLHRRRDRGAGDRARIGKIEKASAGCFQKLCFFDQLCRRFGASLRFLRTIRNAVFARGLRGEPELREHWNAGLD